MGLQGVLESIQASGEAQLGELEAQTNRLVREIHAEAEAQVRAIQQETRDAALAEASAERARILHQARLEVLHDQGGVREALIQATLDQVRGWLRNLRVAESYPYILRRLADESLKEIADFTNLMQEIHLDADPRDQDILSDIVSGLGLKIKVNYSLDSWGGLIARSEDGRIVVINTLESRLDRAIPHLSRYLAAFYEDEIAVSESSLLEVQPKTLTH
jgi:V/A-type H+/Na+-transporting ATPase subunit E